MRAMRRGTLCGPPAMTSPSGERNEARQLAHVRLVREALEGAADLRQGRLEVREEGRVLLHALDEDEAPGVLELALHGDDVELAPEGLAPGDVQAGLGGEVVEAGVHEGAIDRLVAVVEEGDQVVDARAEEGVLEVDPHELGGVARAAAHHEVAALVVAVREAARPGGDAVRE